MNKKEYQDYVEQVTPKVNGWLSFLKAFVSGGIICVIGQCLYNWFKSQGMMHTLANNYTTYTDLDQRSFNRIQPGRTDYKICRGRISRANYRFCQFGGLLCDRI